MDREHLKKIHCEILKWYGENGRKHLPWRNLTGEMAPYGVYVSEIMLQQTQVATILDGYYERFLSEFPSLEALSKADEQKVLLLWQGLGYYSRARNMLKTAKICKKELPSSVEELVKLPGIGDYTAGAIACFGFKKPVSFVDGNIKRVLSRFFGLAKPTMRELKISAQKILNFENSFDHNQALLDIGAMVCVVSSPKCVICPLQHFCKGMHDPLAYTQKKNIKYEDLDIHMGVCIQGGKIALTKSSTTLYKGLYNFPKIKSVEGEEGAEGVEGVEGAKDIEIFTFPLIGILRHSYTRYRIKVSVYRVLDEKYLQEGVEFFCVEKLQSLPMSGIALKILHLTKEKGLLTNLKI